MRWGVFSSLGSMSCTYRLWDQFMQYGLPSTTGCRTGDQWEQQRSPICLDSSIQPSCPIGQILLKAALLGRHPQIGGHFYELQTTYLFYYVCSMFALPETSMKTKLRLCTWFASASSASPLSHHGLSHQFQALLPVFLLLPGQFVCMLLNLPEPQSV